MPAEFAQFAVHEPITLAVGGNFFIPEFPVALGALVALRATVPETAVHKDNNPFPSECEIRFANQLLVAPPAGDTVLTEIFDQAQFGCFVAARADQRHDFGAFLFAPNVAQNFTGSNFLYSSARCRTDILNWLRAFTVDFSVLAFITLEPGSKITRPALSAAK